MVVKVGQAHVKILLGMSQTVFTDSWVIFFLAGGLYALVIPFCGLGRVSP